RVVGLVIRAVEFWPETPVRVIRFAGLDVSMLILVTPLPPFAPNTVNCSLQTSPFDQWIWPFVEIVPVRPFRPTSVVALTQKPFVGTWNWWVKVRLEPFWMIWAGCPLTELV